MMGYTDWLYYAVDNPVTRGTADCIVKVVGAVGSKVPVPAKGKAPVSTSAPVAMSLFSQCGKSKYCLKLTAISGATAVCLGAYGAHRQWSPDIPKDKEYLDDDVEQRKQQFRVANNYHFYHTLALMAVPLSRYPLLSGALFTSGIIFFCGPIYYSSITTDKKYNRLTPFGGVCFIIAWLTLVL